VPAAPPPGEQAHQAGGTYAHNYPGHDQENVEQLGHRRCWVVCTQPRAPALPICRQVMITVRHAGAGAILSKII
jgi:hypothetical protein